VHGYVCDPAVGTTTLRRRLATETSEQTPIPPPPPGEPNYFPLVLLGTFVAVGVYVALM
jgi:hypothetical protein